MNAPSSLLLEAEALLEQRQLTESLRAFHRAELHGADPDRCSGGRWMASMLLGRYSNAWRECDAIRFRGLPDPHRFWDGECVLGRSVIVRCLHGFGDAVQFLRYVRMLRSQAAHVIVEVAPRFLELARCIDGVEHVITWGDQAQVDPPHWDVQIELTELLYFFRTELSDLPLATRYLHLPADTLRSAERELPSPGPPRVGLVWSCGEWNLSRSIPLAVFEPMMRDDGIEFWNLQGGPARDDARALRLPLRDAPRFCADAGLVPLAAFVAQLDLVISVDTFAAHLGGALGIPTWVLLRHAADWRWMFDRDDCPWYPSLRLFRQEKHGGWADVVQRVHQQLASLVSVHSAHKAIA